MLQVVEDHEPKQEECQDDGDGDGEETELLDTVPLPYGDVGHKDEGGQRTKDEPSDLREVVNVGQSSKYCEMRKSVQLIWSI